MTRAKEKRVVAAAPKVIEVESAPEVASCAVRPLLTVAVGPERLVVVCDALLLLIEEVAEVDVGTTRTVLEEEGRTVEEVEGRLEEEEIEDEVVVGATELLLDDEEEVCAALRPNPVAVPPSCALGTFWQLEEAGAACGLGTCTPREVSVWTKVPSPG